MNCASVFLKSRPFLTVCTDRIHRVSAKGEQGWALISVLWVVAMLAMMAAATQALLLTSAKFEQRDLESAEANAALDAAVARSVLGICDQRLDQRWHVDGTVATFKFGGKEIHIKVQDQLGLIDLNAADKSMIRQLLQSIGLTSDDAATMTDRILDWRSDTGLNSNASIKRLHGASNADYAAAGRPYHPRHGPFQTVSELQLVLGITPTLYAQLAPALTVYSNRPATDPNLAPKPVLEALYLDAPEQADAVLRARQGLGGDDAQSGISPGALNPAIALAGRSFSINAEVTLGQRQYARNVVIELTGDDNRPYLILAWQ